MKKGYVYVMANPAFKDNLRKIGFTEKEPEERAKQLYRSGVPRPFIVEYAREFNDCKKAEFEFHKKFKSKRTNLKREFFEISLLDAIVGIDNLAIEELQEELDRQEQAFQKLELAYRKLLNLRVITESKSKQKSDKIKGLERFINQFRSEKEMQKWWENLDTHIKLSLLKSHKLLFKYNKIHIELEQLYSEIQQIINDEYFIEFLTPEKIESISEIEIILEENNLESLLDLEYEITEVIDSLEEYDKEWYEQILSQDIISQYFDFSELFDFMTTLRIELNKKPSERNQLRSLIFLENLKINYRIDEDILEVVKSISSLKSLTINSISSNEIQYLLNKNGKFKSLFDTSELENLFFNLFLDKKDITQENIIKNQLIKNFPNCIIISKYGQMNLFGGLTQHFHLKRK